MRRSTPLLTLWRVVLQARTPLSIGTGRGDGVNDVVLATDANALPLLPASSLAGVMRAALAAWQGESVARELFGSAAGDAGVPSRVVLSHGHIHDSHDCPVLALQERVSDALLAPLTTRRPMQRQRVRLHHRGAAADQALFDRAVLPAGHRFSVEVALWRSPDDAASSLTAAPEWLHALLCVEGLRVGAQTRSGLGRLQAVRVHRRDYDLRRAEDLQAWTGLSPALDDRTGLRTVVLDAAAPAALRAGRRCIDVMLQPEAGFRFGDGGHSLQPTRSSKLPDDLPKTEPQVRWDNGLGRMETPEEAAVLVPASSVKGALAHRVAFHARRLAGAWADAARAARLDQGSDCPSVRRLFGHANDKEADHASGAQGQAGLLWIEDARIARQDVVAQTRMHNSLDRFTGGVREGLLFSAENLHAARPGRPLLRFQLVLDTRRAAAVGLDAVDLQALALALDDLGAGRLALGADSAGGLGFFTGHWFWDGDGRAPRLDEKHEGGEAAR